MKLNYFNFKELNGKILLTNDFGKYVFVEREELRDIIKGDVRPDTVLGKKLLAAKIAYEGNELDFSCDNKFELRRVKDHVNTATSLHIFVVTTACNMNCVYCQANSGKKRPYQFMDKETAEKAVDVALQSPAVNLNFEFQGGEPLMNFDVIKHIVEYTEKCNVLHNINYNIVTNLTLLNDNVLNYLAEHGFVISTSIDGDMQTHDKNRTMLHGGGTYDSVISAVKRIKAAGLRVGAIETTTRDTLNHANELVKTYAELGLQNIFIRPLTPLGKALANWSDIGYTPEEFIAFYRDAFSELISLNAKGYFIQEQHASIFLKRISGQNINYMELRSPCGAGVGQMAYFPDGGVFTCDEGRMMHEMGEDVFCLGNVFRDSFSELIRNKVCRTVCASSILESIPSCCDCAYQPYCGTCPVINYALFNDIIEKSPRGFRCKIYSGILDILFSEILKNDSTTVGILNSWSN